MSIGVTTIILFAVFALLLFASCPISVSIVLASIVAAISSLSWDQITFITMQKMNSGVESFSLHGWIYSRNPHGPRLHGGGICLREEA